LSNQPILNKRADAPVARTPALPDMNAETYPFGVVQHLVDQAAIINAFATHDPNRANSGIQVQSGSAIGMELKEILYSFDVSIRPVEPKGGVSAANVVGRPIGQFTHRWLVIPDDFAASPGRHPAPTPLDPSRSQRFVMQDGVFTFGDGSDGFHGFGTGATYPMNINGRQLLLAAAVGEVIDGYGRFEGLEGSYVLSGELTTQGGFEGNIQCRLTDPGGQIRTESDVGPAEGTRKASSNLSYIMFRGQKKNENVKTSFIFDSNGLPLGFKLKQELRILHVHSIRGSRRGLRSSVILGRVIGWMSSEVFLNILNPGAPGTSLAPIPFSSYNEFTFTDDDGNTIGSFAAEGGEGRSFNVKLAGAPGQQALRFGAFQTLAKGTGCFEGVQGLFTDNSIVGVAPHVTSTLYVACICDPEGRFRAP
jgi:hypothetical protein